MDKPQSEWTHQVLQRHCAGRQAQLGSGIVLPEEARGRLIAELGRTDVPLEPIRQPPSHDTAARRSRPVVVARPKPERPPARPAGNPWRLILGLAAAAGVLVAGVLWWFGPGSSQPAEIARLDSAETAPTTRGTTGTFEPSGAGRGVEPAPVVESDALAAALPPPGPGARSLTADLARPESLPPSDPTSPPTVARRTLDSETVALAAPPPAAASRPAAEGDPLLTRFITLAASAQGPAASHRFVLVDADRNPAPLASSREGEALPLELVFDSDAGALVIHNPLDGAPWNASWNAIPLTTAGAHTVAALEALGETAQGDRVLRLRADGTPHEGDGPVTLVADFVLVRVPAQVEAVVSRADPRIALELWLGHALVAGVISSEDAPPRSFQALPGTLAVP